jgi:hypothetical protein
MAINKASKASGYMKQISSLDEKVSSLTAKIIHNEECKSFILGIIESACEMLRCKFSFDSSFPCLSPAVFVTPFAIIGTCLDFATEDRRVTERNAALEKMLAGLLLQDRA